MATLHFELVAPERVHFSGEVEAVMLPGTEGDMTVLPGHAPVMTALKAGFVVITNHKDVGARVLVRGGFAEINATGVTVLAERATPVEELTPEKIDHEILEISTMRDGSEDWKAREAADAMIAQLEEAKVALKFLSGGAPPLVLTLALDGASFALLDRLRRRHFPPDRNVVPAHLTLFHALPGSEARAVRAHLAAVCGRQRPFTLLSTKLRSLGRGVAIGFAAPDLMALRAALQREWRDWLTPQDSAPLAPHVTIQNKADPAAARALLQDLQATLPPIAATAEGLLLWSYLGGPWSLDRRFRFTG